MESAPEAFFISPRVHWIRNALAHVPRGQHDMVAAAIRQAFIQPDRKSAGATWRRVADQFRPKAPKVATLMDEAEEDVFAYMNSPPGTASSGKAPIRSSA